MSQRGLRTFAEIDAAHSAQTRPTVLRSTIQTEVPVNNVSEIRSKFENLLPEESIDLPLPAVALGRRSAYQRIQTQAWKIFGARNYKLRADGNRLNVTRLGGSPLDG